MAEHRGRGTSHRRGEIGGSAHDSRPHGRRKYGRASEFKDECRKDPSVPRYILVEIAKSKQDRGMLISSFVSLKTRLEKTAGDDAIHSFLKTT